VAGVLKIALYSEDGQTQIFNITTPTISAAGQIHSFSVGSVSVGAGVYYLVIVPVGTANIEVYMNNTNTNQGLYSGITGEPVIEGTAVVTAGTLPATVTPTTITYANARTASIRLDN
jgi:hypothetical protein